MRSAVSRDLSGRGLPYDEERVEHLSDDRARELALALSRRVQGGADERELRDVVANALRARKREASELVERFLDGYHAGVREALGSERGGRSVEGDVLWEQAFANGRDYTERLIASRRRGPRRAFGWRLLIVALVAFLVVLLLWV